MLVRHKARIARKAETWERGACSTAGEQLESARESDAAWRAARKARFGRPLVWLQRCTGPLEIGLGVLAFGAVAVMFLTVAISPKPVDFGRWQPGLLDPYVYIIERCIVAFLVLAVAAVTVRGLSEWLQRRIRARAAAQAVELDD